MTKKDMKNQLQQILNETENTEEFQKQWDLSQEELYPFMVGFIRAGIKFILNEGEIILD